MARHRRISGTNRKIIGLKMQILLSSKPTQHLFFVQTQGMNRDLGQFKHQTLLATETDTELNLIVEANPKGRNPNQSLAEKFRLRWVSFGLSLRCNLRVWTAWLQNAEQKPVFVVHRPPYFSTDQLDPQTGLNGSHKLS